MGTRKIKLLSKTSLLKWMCKLNNVSKKKHFFFFIELNRFLRWLVIGSNLQETWPKLYQPIFGNRSISDTANYNQYKSRPGSYIHKIVYIISFFSVKVCTVFNSKYEIQQILLKTSAVAFAQNVSNFNRKSIENYTVQQLDLLLATWNRLQTSSNHR